MRDSRRELWRRLLWVGSLVATLGAAVALLARFGAGWGIGAAP